jgi:ABC-2 type transport system ATP-binding protein
VTAAMSALRTDGLGKQYGRRWALQGSTFAVPAGSVVALVGPNGAGKTTLLHLAAGLLRPTAGAITVFGGDSARDLDLLPRIGLVAQDMPLYKGLTVRDTLRLGQKLNPRWDNDMAVDRLAQLGIDLGQKVGTLSGGQRAQVALAVALGKRPELLLLDEPLASLDPLARREFMQTLMLTAAEGDLTIVLSSHLIADLERVCDHLVLVAAGRTQLADGIDTLLATHRVLIGPRTTGPIPGVAEIVDESTSGRQTSMIVRVDGPIHDPRWTTEEVALEELVLAYLSQAQGAANDTRLHALDIVGAAS